ncbi:hypothetical protein GYMLUDRAFT_266292 [Collybiopsis luxurians FD-317 M1]|uniref:Uncharacterized protein n=1 Tax=Collybiopsis luxurians FD-317 M1 TaxID=944289 RepID=A0A0D0BW59_9AGAR|nr:hypothetical protein GYMLUDRAFT_266292 [Collybiopsis luxurians FD-317 M1]
MTNERRSILLCPSYQADVSASLDELAKEDADTEGDLPELEDLCLCNRGAHAPRVRSEDDIWATVSPPSSRHGYALMRGWCIGEREGKGDGSNSGLVENGTGREEDAPAIDSTTCQRMGSWYSDCRRTCTWICGGKKGFCHPYQAIVLASLDEELQAWTANARRRRDRAGRTCWKLR